MPAIHDFDDMPACMRPLAPTPSDLDDAAEADAFPVVQGALDDLIKVTLPTRRMERAVEPSVVVSVHSLHDIAKRLERVSLAPHAATYSHRPAARHATHGTKRSLTSLLAPRKHQKHGSWSSSPHPRRQV